MASISYLYKYRSLAGQDIDWVEETILKSTIRFGCVADFNDPFDSAPIYELKGTQKEIEAHLMGIMARRSPNMSRAERRKMVKAAAHPRRRQAYLTGVGKGMRNEVEKLGVYCLSEVPDHVLMWAHYSDSHKGVCLRFKGSSTTPFFGTAQQVHYKIDRPIVDPLHNTHDELANNALLTKADYWSYEKEWRIVDYGNPPGVKAFPPQLLDGIILGARIDPAAEKRIRACVAKRTNPMEVFRASLNPKSFRLQLSLAP